MFSGYNKRRWNTLSWNNCKNFHNYHIDKTWPWSHPSVYPICLAPALKASHELKDLTLSWLLNSLEEVLAGNLNGMGILLQKYIAVIYFITGFCKQNTLSPGEMVTNDDISWDNILKCPVTATCFSQTLWTDALGSTGLVVMLNRCCKNKQIFFTTGTSIWWSDNTLFLYYPTVKNQKTKTPWKLPTFMSQDLQWVVV